MGERTRSVEWRGRLDTPLPAPEHQIRSAGTLRVPDIPSQRSFQRSPRRDVARARLRVFSRYLYRFVLTPDDTPSSAERTITVNNFNVTRERTRVQGLRCALLFSLVIAALGLSSARAQQ